MLAVPLPIFVLNRDGGGGIATVAPRAGRRRRAWARRRRLSPGGGINAVMAAPLPLSSLFIRDDGEGVAIVVVLARAPQRGRRAAT